MALAFAGILLSFLFVLFCLRRSLFVQKDRKNGVPVNYPLAGMLPALLANHHRLQDWLVDVLAVAGCNFAFKGPWFSSQDCLFTADLANINYICNQNHGNYSKGRDFTEIFQGLGNGIFNSQGESWRYQRKRTHAHMSSASYRDLVSSSGQAKIKYSLLAILNELAEQNEAVDLQDVFLRFTFDVTCVLVLGTDPGCLSPGFPTIPFAKAVDDANEAVLFRHTVPKFWWKLLRWLRAGKEKKLALAHEVENLFIARHISKRRREETEENDKLAQGNVLSFYISTEADEFLRDTVMNFLVAGRDTTGAALTWFIWLVCKNPLVEEKLIEELREIAPMRDDDEGTIVFDDEELAKLVYLHAALCEAMRLFPPVPLNHKAALEADVLPSGHRLRPEMRVIISMYAMGRMEAVWGKDCLAFKPERWISEKGKLRHEPSYKFTAFSSGPRSCLGKETAFTQMKAAAAAVMYNFRVEVAEGHVVTPKLSLILHMKNGLMAKLTKRSIGG